MLKPHASLPIPAVWQMHLADEDRETALALAEPVFAGLGLENLILISPQGNELVHLILDENGKLQRVEQDTGAANSAIVTPFLEIKTLRNLRAAHWALIW